MRRLDLSLTGTHEVPFVPAAGYPISQFTLVISASALPPIRKAELLVSFEVTAPPVTASQTSVSLERIPR